MQSNADTLSPSQRLRQLLAKEGCLDVPGVGDPLSARLAHTELGFDVLFVSGFYVSASMLGLPDVDMLGYADMSSALARIRCAVPNAILIVDGDTGYGGPSQVRRTIRGFGQGGAACVMIEDQLAPKQCGHTEGKQVVPFAEACTRMQAAVDERNQMGSAGPLIMARTDARVLGKEEAHRRGRAFRDIGVDVVFMEAPPDEASMKEDCTVMKGTSTMANLVEFSKTPLLGKTRIEELGYKIAIHPVTLLNASLGAMFRWGKELRDGDGKHDSKVQPTPPESTQSSDGGKSLPELMGFNDLQRMVGFQEYYGQRKRYQDAHASYSAEGANKKPRTS